LLRAPEVERRPREDPERTQRGPREGPKLSPAAPGVVAPKRPRGKAAGRNAEASHWDSQKASRAEDEEWGDAAVTNAR
jgi:hypothetical protein